MGSGMSVLEQLRSERMAAADRAFLYYRIKHELMTQLDGEGERRLMDAYLSGLEDMAVLLGADNRLRHVLKQRARASVLIR